MDFEEKRRLFIELFEKAEKKYKNLQKRLAGEGWDSDWKMLFATICSAQNRDEVTIPVMEEFFKKFDSLEKIAGADIQAIRNSISKINYCDSKAEYLKESAKILIDIHNKKVPKQIEDLIKLPGVGRKTANLFLSEFYNQDTITVDTHVHRISNVFKLVNTKNAEITEKELMKIAPKEYWKKINRIFVLWGKDCPGYNSEKLINVLKTNQI